MSTMLQTEHLTFAYPAEEGQSAPTAALEDVTLSVEKGSFVVVLGHNGSGKSTLAKQMNAVLLPCGGTVYVDGMDTKQEALLLEIRRRVGMVFQNPDNQIVANVVEEDVAFAPENLGIPTGEIRRRGRRFGGGGHVGIYPPCAPSALRRTEAAGGHRRRDRHGAGVRGAGRGHRHAGPLRTA